MLASNVALAQGQGGRRGGGGGGFGGGMGGGGVGFLLMSPQVQKELKLSEDQVAKIGEINREAFAAFAGGGQRGQNLSDEERAKRDEERAKRTEENNKKLLAVLDADQTTRVKQIQLWVGGTAGVANNEEAAKELKLTDDQKAAFKAISEEARKKRQELGGGGRGGSDEERAKRREQFTSLQKDTEAECLAVLTDEQKSQFAKMRGPKFELDMAALGGRGGPGGGQRRRGGTNN